MNTIKDKKPSYKVFEKLLKENNLSIYRVANDLGIAVQNIYDWRDGISSPKAYRLIVISDYFGVDIKAFFEGEIWQA